MAHLQRSLFLKSSHISLLEPALWLPKLSRLILQTELGISNATQLSCNMVSEEHLSHWLWTCSELQNCFSKPKSPLKPSPSFLQPPPAFSQFWHLELAGHETWSFSACGEKRAVPPSKAWHSEGIMRAFSSWKQGKVFPIISPMLSHTHICLQKA